MRVMVNISGPLLADLKKLRKIWGGSEDVDPDILIQFCIREAYRAVKRRTLSEDVGDWVKEWNESKDT